VALGHGDALAMHGVPEAIHARGDDEAIGRRLVGRRAGW
jgi:hypothetical protein